MTQRQRDQLKILLLQIRQDPVTLLEEQQEFIRYSGLAPSQIDSLNVFQTPHVSAEMLQGYQALFIGGSSDATVLDPVGYPFVPFCEDLLRHCVDCGLPVFASCFGFQLLVVALGGTVIRDRANLEMGVYPLSLTAEAQTDGLLQDLPNPFFAVSGHQERAANLPASLISLAFSAKCPYHAIKVLGQPIYGFQFHPEVDAPDLKARLLRYQDRYLDSSAQVQEILASLKDTRAANRLIERFIDRIVLPSL